MSIATSGNNVYGVWSYRDSDTHIRDIFYRMSSDRGQTFTDPVNLSNSSNADSRNPVLATSGNNVYITWIEKIRILSDVRDEKLKDILELKGNKLSISLR
jgi:hypothetical protein